MWAVNPDDDVKRTNNPQHFQEPIKQPLEKSGNTILTKCLPTGGRNQLIKKGPRG
jgi:hypothetical protein